MSEEMNLYKRCKNIFKNHGVDMGGGESGIPEAPVDGKQYARKDGDWSEVVGGSGGSFIVNLTAGDDETWTSDKTFVEIKQALENGQFVVVKFSINGKDCIVSGGSLMPHDTDKYEVIVWVFGASGAVLCTGNEDETYWQLG